MKPPTAPPPSSSPPAKPGDAGHLNIAGKRVSWDAVMMAGAGVLGGWFLLRSHGSSTAAGGAASSVPWAATPTSTGTGMDTALPPPPGSSGATQGPDFASGLYGQVLHRDSTADTSGAAYWDAYAASQGGDAATAAFLATPEAQIQQDYARSLGRPADQSGLNYWLGQAQSGASLSSIAASIAGSKEAASRHV